MTMKSRPSLDRAWRGVSRTAYETGVPVSWKTLQFAACLARGPGQWRVALGRQAVFETVEQGVHFRRRNQGERAGRDDPAGSRPRDRVEGGKQALAEPVRRPWSLGVGE